MIAEAIYESVPGAARVSVDLATIRWSDPRVGLRYTYLTPKPVVKALLLFDAGKQVHPFKFQLRGGHATSMHTGGQKKQTLVHKFGKPTILGADEQRDSSGITNWTETVESVGGKPKPRMPRLNPQHVSHNTVRVYGLQGFSPEFAEDLRELLAKK